METNSNTILLQTRDYCIACLGKLNQEVISHSSQNSSLQNACRYLNVNTDKVFSEALKIDFEKPLAVRQWEFRGQLCSECEQLFWSISEISQEMERLEKMKNFSIKSINDKMKISGEGNCFKEFRKEMLSNAETIFHLGIVEQLRKEFLNESSAILAKVKPEDVQKRPVCILRSQSTSEPELIELSDDDGDETIASTEDKLQLPEESVLTEEVKISEEEEKEKVSFLAELNLIRPRSSIEKEKEEIMKLKCFRCQHCPEVFRLRVGLKQHCQAKHSQDEDEYPNKENHQDVPIEERTAQINEGESQKELPVPPPEPVIENDCQNNVASSSENAQETNLSATLSAELNELINFTPNQQVPKASPSLSNGKFRCETCPKTFPYKSWFLNHKCVRNKKLRKTKMNSGGESRAQSASTYPPMETTDLTGMPQLEPQVKFSSQPVKRKRGRVSKKAFTGLSKLKCGVCNSKFMTNEGLIMHVRRAHPANCYFE